MKNINNKVKNTIEDVINYNSKLDPLYKIFKADNLHNLLNKVNDIYYLATRRFNIYH